MALAPACETTDDTIDPDSYFGAKSGAIEHGPKFFAQPTCHWKPEVTSGVRAVESAELLKEFFKARRK